MEWKSEEEEEVRKKRFCPYEKKGMLTSIDATNWPEKPKHYYKCPLTEEKGYFFRKCPDFNCKYAKGKEFLETEQLSFKF